jgi:hypothetical protein
MVSIDLSSQWGSNSVSKCGLRSYNLLDARRIREGTFDHPNSTGFLLSYSQADSYGPLRVLVNGQVQGSIIDMQDEQLITALRRAVGSAFAVKILLDYRQLTSTIPRCRDEGSNEVLSIPDTLK